MEQSTISFIGGGNMASSLIGGLVAGDCKPENIWVSDPDRAKLDNLRSRYGINVQADNHMVVERADVVVLAVKPQVIKQVAEEIAEALACRNPLLISIAAGIREPSLQGWLGGGAAIVRTMPNTPALVQSGATALYANAQVSEAQRDLAESILRTVGLTLWLDDEGLMDAVTALSGSGPAYFFLLMEVLENAGVELGLPRESARLLTLQTAFGAAKMALEIAEDSATLRKRVTSPGGTTERALQVLQQADVQATFSQALRAACERSRELADLLGKQ